MEVKLSRVILPVTSVAAAAQFYGKVHEDGDASDLLANPEHVYFAVDDLAAIHSRCRDAGCKRLDADIKSRPWGERSFYAEDPFGNKICFVDQTTAFTG